MPDLGAMAKGSPSVYSSTFCFNSLEVSGTIHSFENAKRFICWVQAASAAAAAASAAGKTTFLRSSTIPLHCLQMEQHLNGGNPAKSTAYLAYIYCLH